ncbi:MAG: TIGR03619 family F420-dependent LLM class oxidoreductase [Saccharopolyspora sp.]|uniref:TIGR03619 family F420-dependent LLM class oxidoreductase n=1 Tax=Saccharopolyspora sp. TaxID=33915 RepID=UPI0025E8CB00|nr:TIGR03619 family F420-dependent LLM class oxidoreductase [Saccharopolyspora sp.]MBQ6643531.1 TIGR03619 family F420-dependent LLM class oxidoreductase [Saccharopolyspora sp.]
MRLGLGLPQFGPFADPACVHEVATEAEGMGFESLWAGERLHAPRNPSTPYPGSADGSLPDRMRASLDPLLVLTVAASATNRAALGTSTLNAPLYAPIALARALTGVDRLSNGRLIPGFGLGWMRDEYEAAGVPWHQRAARLDDALTALRALWGPDPVRHQGRFSTVSPGDFQPKPVQPSPPIYLGGSSEAALRRTATRGDGWLGVALPLPALERVLGMLREFAAEAGRAPAATALRVNVELGPPGARPVQGPVERIVDYLHAVAELGVQDAFVDLQFTTPDVPSLLRTAARFRSAFPS